jgi:hypothetical protein
VLVAVLVAVGGTAVLVAAGGTGVFVLVAVGGTTVCVAVGRGVLVAVAGTVVFVAVAIGVFGGTSVAVAVAVGLLLVQLTLTLPDRASPVLLLGLVLRYAVYWCVAATLVLTGAVQLVPVLQLLRIVPLSSRIRM